MKIFQKKKKKDTYVMIKIFYYKCCHFSNYSKIPPNATKAKKKEKLKMERLEEFL